MFEIVIIRRLIIVIFIVTTTFQVGTTEHALYNREMKNVKEILENINGKLNVISFKMEYLDNAISPLNARLQVLETAITDLTSKFDTLAMFIKNPNRLEEGNSQREHSKRSSSSAEPDQKKLDRIVQEQHHIKNAIELSTKVTAEMNATLHQLNRPNPIQGGPPPADLVQPTAAGSAVRDVILEFLEDASLAAENSPANENVDKYRDAPATASRVNTKPKKIHTVELLRQIWKKFTRPIWNISKSMNELQVIGAKGADFCERSFNQANKIEVLLSKHFVETTKPAFNCCESMLKSIGNAISRSDAQYDSLEQRMVYQNSLIEKLFDKLPSITSVQVDVDATLVENEVETRASDCAQLQNNGVSADGVYTVNVNDRKLDVYCDFAAYDGGWTVIQRRGKYGSYLENFNRNWSEYKNGFGDIDREFWIGNDNLHWMTKDNVTLLVELKDFQDNYAFAFYNLFRVNSEEDFYRLHIGDYNGNASDSFAAHNQKLFSTKDQIHDEVDPCCSCALTFEGGWWFYACFEAHLNGPYQPVPTDNGYFRGIIWEHWKGDYSLKASEMKIRPRNFQTANRKSNIDDENEASVEDP